MGRNTKNITYTSAMKHYDGGGGEEKAWILNIELFSTANNFSTNLSLAVTRQT